MTDRLPAFRDKNDASMPAPLLKQASLAVEARLGSRGSVQRPRNFEYKLIQLEAVT
ncbi:hypothetical protein [Mesorhizobium sp. ES1-4]|uniref:hypothetical protein n=1 Tax=Mesorhizobium sp. ES1-4 TaxID=2876627 RepID=UPI001CCDB37C|nr:hypothetical protein [Mesorhizobium sp. ES1-4]MBZ9795092.1 hypothetical protein [Mesorhizobium sp. ES1-4]